MKKHCLSLFVLLLTGMLTALAQPVTLNGTIRDKHSNEIIPFASLYLLQRGEGKLADSSGGFSFYFTTPVYDTLEISFAGFEDFLLPLDSAFYSTADADGVITVAIQMEPSDYGGPVIIRRKIDRGLLLWRRIVARKPFNDQFRFSNFSYELYNKLELDLKNLNHEKLGELKLMRPFKFIFELTDSVEGASVLPVYLTETISDYYFQRNPVKRREIIRATKTLGVNNESVSKMLGGMDQVVNVYSNFIPVFDKQFVSPLSDNGDAYYSYKILDTQIVAGLRMIHLAFVPRRKGENTFTGDCWIHDSTFAIQKMNLRLTREANVNFVDKLSLIQEYRLINDSTWFPARDKFVVDIAPLGKTSLAFIGKKTTTYRSVQVNDERVSRELDKNKIKEEIIVAEASAQQPEDYWTASRHEELSRSEQAVYDMIDTLLKMPVFTKYTNWINFLGTGYKRIGNYEIGPWYNWITYNQLEGYRTRFDLGTNRHFNKKIILHGYLAYGWGDKKFKYKAEALYLLKKHPRTFLYGSWLKDIDYGQTYYDEISQDNIFALAIRKSGVPIKFLMIDEKRLEFFRETPSGFSVLATGLNKTFDPLRNLPPKELFDNGRNTPLATTEFSLRFRYAYLEKFIENNFYRSSLGSPYPITELRITRGVSGLLNSNYSYTKLSGSISSYKKIPPFGSLYYNVFGGRTFGTLPYMLLDLAPGNEIYYYNKYAFNLMNRYEYLHDRYLGLNVEHNIGSGIFRYIPLTRKLKFRQFYSIRGLWGSLGESNARLNMPVGSEYRFESLNGRSYLEVGTGVDNIFRIFRIDFIWRVLPRPLPPEPVKRFGVFGSFRVSF